MKDRCILDGRKCGRVREPEPRSPVGDAGQTVRREVEEAGAVVTIEPNGNRGVIGIASLLYAPKA